MKALREEFMLDVERLEARQLPTVLTIARKGSKAGACSIYEVLVEEDIWAFDLD